MDTTLHQIREQQQQQVLKLAHNFSLGSPRILGSTGKGGSSSVRVRWDEVGRVCAEKGKEMKGWGKRPDHFHSPGAGHTPGVTGHYSF
ncbi:hypothetical protein Pmani_037865 [Petrolisthes manimaculis]|uniref:Uncharacterized protein n=1 Tax=Petrolisthes manimaculis TaxID=1843537 RepID=A0AAE1NHH1_9EUCA|nr:hypothetical protein Pmani_037865 [Petrolisthes manimaculis]